MDNFGIGSMAYLTRRWRDGERFSCRLSDSQDFLNERVVAEEVFTSSVICDLFLPAPRAPWVRELVAEIERVVTPRKPIRFFKERDDLLPPDVDCTAYLYSVAIKCNVISRPQAREVAQLVSDNRNAEGVIEVYFDSGGTREGLIDPAVCTNALFLLCQVGVDSDLGPTERRVLQHLESGDYVNGTRYYPSPDTFLFFLARLVASHPARYGRWTPPLVAALKTRIGLDSRPIELAQRVLAATRLGVDAALDIWKLRTAQRVDGEYPPGALFRFGKTARYFGGELITTAFAARALVEYGRALRFSARRPGAPQGIPPSATLRRNTMMLNFSPATSLKGRESKREPATPWHR